MNTAERFLAAFPNAAETNGWTTVNLKRLVADSKRMKISGDEFQRGLDVLLRRSRRTSVPLYGEVFGVMKDIVGKRAATEPDATITRLSRIRDEYQPPTPEQRADRWAWLEQRGAVRKSKA